MRVLGILAGIGTLLREAQDLGMTVVGNYELRAPFRTDQSVWEANFPNASVNEDRLDWNNADLVLGHPPCGSHSALGSTHSLDLPAAERAAKQARRSKRVGLLPEFVAGVNRYKPKIFALDNLTKILDKIAPTSWWSEVLPSYRLTYLNIRNWDYGTPQRRDRLWIIGVRKPGPVFVFRAPPSGIRLSGPRTVFEALKGLPWEPWLDNPTFGHVHLAPWARPFGSYPTTDRPPRYVNETDEQAFRYLQLEPKEAWPYRTRTTDRLTTKFARVRLDGEAISSVISSGTLQHPLTGWPLTPRERARIMDWPDDFALATPFTQWDRRYHARLNLFTGKAVPSRFPRYLIPQLIRHLQRS